MLHADACRAVASHGVANQATASSLWNRAVMSIDIRDNIVRDESLKVSGRYRIRIHGAVVQVFESGRTTIISFAPWAKAPSMVWGTWISWDHCSAPMEYPWSAYTTG